MEKLLDLRFIIGLFFLLTGLILFGYSFTSDLNPDAQSIDCYCGVFFASFGILMLMLQAFSKPIIISED